MMWRFGTFELDAESRELRNRGLRIKVPRQAFATLAILVERAGELVTREDLCQQLWPDGRHVNFEGNLNAIIRDVRGALGDSARQARYIETEPTRGYRFVAPVSVLARTPPEAPRSQEQSATPSSPPGRRTAMVVGGLTVSTLVFMVGFAIFRGWPGAAPGIRIVSLTNYVGIEGHPSFSPDGSRVAFEWNGQERGDFDIYVKRLGSDTLQRLTTDPADDRRPAWSPDGRDIAFLRESSQPAAALMLVSAVGGQERRVAELPAGASFAWSADGRWIVYSESLPNYVQSSGAAQGLRAISLQTGQTVSITTPDRGFLGDAFPAVSPGGRSLAFVRLSSIGAGDLWVIDVTHDMRPAGRPRRLTFDPKDNCDPAWLPDGRTIVFSSSRGGSYSLWKVSAAGRSPVEPLGGEDAIEPAVDPRTGHVAYSRLTLVDSLSTLPLAPGERAPQPPRRLLYSQKQARNPAWSPDGRRIAYESARSGHSEIWICDQDRTNEYQLTHFGGALTGTPRWAPDGRRLVFDSRVSGKGQIFTIPIDGRQPLQMTSGAENIVPFWSHDGRYIYFASDRSGTFQIWKMPAGGGQPSQVTHNGGFYAVESTDGQTLYYTREITQTWIWRTPVAGGPEERLAGPISDWLNFAVSARGIFFVPGAGSKPSFSFFDFGSGRTRKIAPVNAFDIQGVSLSPDSNTILFARRETADRDLMLLETVP